jgi:hypothetical protein
VLSHKGIELYGLNYNSPELTVLRRKLGDDPETGRYITTVRGVGYRMGQG